MRDVRPALSIVVPAYNEGARIAGSLRAIDAYARTFTIPLELIVVDDGSTDDTAAIVQRNLPMAPNVTAVVLQYGANRGKGFAVRHGLLHARAPIALFTDADLSTPLSEISGLVAPIDRDEADVTFGSRALNRALIGVRQPRWRELGGRAFNVALRAATGLPFVDTQCGCKAFRMSVCRPLLESANIDGFGFDVELLYGAHRASLRLREIPVRWDHREGSKVRFVRDGSRMLRDILAVRLRGLRGFYDSGIRRAGAASRLERRAPVAGRLPA
jgi:dolichyl-phosphate beta-glucosyltransferase